MAENAIIPCPHCGESCAVAPQHLSRRLACPHCGDEFVPADAGRSGARGGGGGGRGRGGRGGGGGGGAPRRRASGNNGPILAVGGVAVLLVLILGVALMGAQRSRSGRQRDRDTDGTRARVTDVSETQARSDTKPRGGGDAPVDPDSTIQLSQCPSGSYAVNGTIFNATRSVRIWKDPQKLWQGRRAGMIAHQEPVEALGMGKNASGIPIYKVRGKSKLGGKTIEGYVSAFYIEKDNKAVAEHKFEWVDEDDWELHGISKEDRD